MFQEAEGILNVLRGFGTAGNLAAALAGGCISLGMMDGTSVSAKSAPFIRLHFKVGGDMLAHIPPPTHTHSSKDMSEAIPAGYQEVFTGPDETTSALAKR